MTMAIQDLIENGVEQFEEPRKGHIQKNKNDNKWPL